jgi:hypothetical protein
MRDGDGSSSPRTTEQNRMSNPAEWQARVDLAALYRLVALHGWDDMIFTHIWPACPGRAPFPHQPLWPGVSGRLQRRR